LQMTFRRLQPWGLACSQAPWTCGNFSTMPVRRIV
jgi:hypothetical protein